MNYKITRFISIIKHRIHLDDRVIFSADENLELSGFLKQAYLSLKISYPRFHKMDELSKLGILGAELLLQDIEVPEDSALVFSNSSSSYGSDKLHQDSLYQIVSPSVFVYTLPNIVMGEICIKHKIYGENVFFISEDFKPDLIWEYSQSLLQNGAAPAIVCGWIEWKNDEYDVFLCLISGEGELAFSAENLEVLYHVKNE